MIGIERDSLNAPSFFDNNISTNKELIDLGRKDKKNLDAQDNSNKIISYSAFNNRTIKANDTPILSKRTGVKPADFGLTITDLIFLLKKLDQIALKQSADGMVAARSSVNRKAAAIKQEGVLNCAAQVTGAAVQMGVTGYSAFKSGKGLNKQGATENKVQDLKKNELSKLEDSHLKNKSAKINEFDKRSENYLKKYNEVNSNPQSQIDKLKNEIPKLEGNRQSLLKENKNMESAESHRIKSNIDAKKSELVRLEKELNNDIADQKDVMKKLNNKKDNELKELDLNHEKAKADIKKQPENLGDNKEHNNMSSSFENQRTYDHLSHAIGSIFSSSIYVAAYTEKAKQANAELESSVDHKTTDNNRERSNSYKNSASELINSINAILEKHTATIGEIARKC